MTIVIFALSILSLLLLIAATAAPLARHLNLPQPVLFAALGLSIGLGTAISGLEVYQGALDNYQRWFVEQLALDTSALLHVFLPPLLFEMALVVNLRRLIGDAVAVLVMAILAVVIPCFLSAEIIYLSFSVRCVYFMFFTSWREQTS